jgi:lantibiotic biosynthesis protein
MPGRDGAAADFAPSGFFVLRTPLLPLSDFAQWGAGLEAPACVSGSERLHDAVERDRVRLRTRLAATAARPEFREAVFVASPSLDAAIGRWQNEPDTERARSVERSLVSYLARATARPTPFGLFAGCTTGSVSARTRLRLASRERYRRHSRLDMEFLWSLAQAVESDPGLRVELVYQPNSSLYELGDRLYFAEASQEQSGRSYRLVAVDKTPYLAATLERARGGERLDALAAALVDEDITRADADGFVGELVDSQLLAADVRPKLTGEAPTGVLIRTLARRPATAPIAERLDDARGRLAAIDAEPVGAPPDRYRAVAAALDGLPVSPELSRLVQVDLSKPAADISLGRDVVAELLRGVGVLHAFSRARPADALARFREEFVRRYETRDVPLVEALDEENGIGFDRSSTASAEAAALLGGLALDGGEEQFARWTARDTLLLDKLSRALAGGASHIAVDASDIAAAGSSDTPPLPDAFEVVASVEAASEEALDRSDFRVVIQSVSGPSGARLLGRFCHLDEALHGFVADHLRAEERRQPDRVFAEIVHLPEGRVGNILSRPVLRAYEIPYLGDSGADTDRQLPAGDLLVGVEADRIVLRSRRLGREVVPRLTTAHNHAWRSLGIYRFLCALQHQGVVPGLTWDWGPLEHAAFLPRVVCGRTVLSRRRWNLDRRELAAFAESPGARQFAAVQQLRAARALPRWAALADGDNELLMDLDNVLSIEAVGHRLKRRTSAALVELLPGPDALCATGPEGSYTHQITVPFVRSSPAPSSRPPQRAGAGTAPRRFPPGSDWLYVKLYTGTATADRVLDAAAPVVEEALGNGSADRWFFIRYGDPDWHVRLRVHGHPDRLLHETLPALHATMAPLLDRKELWRVQLDTYEREVERYGGDRAIDVAEAIFHADSDAVLAILRGLAGESARDLRWRAAIAGIDLLFDDFGLTLAEKRALARRACDGYGKEFGAGKAFQRQLSRRYREERPHLEALLGHHGQAGEAPGLSIAALTRRSAAVRSGAAELRALADAGELSASIGDVAMSVAHMHVNRILRSAQRAQELVLYEFLDRVYSSLAAREGR